MSILHSTQNCKIVNALDLMVDTVPQAQAKLIEILYMHMLNWTRCHTHTLKLNVWVGNESFLGNHIRSLMRLEHTTSNIKSIYVYILIFSSSTFNSALFSSSSSSLLLSKTNFSFAITMANIVCFRKFYQKLVLNADDMSYHVG